ncbi:Zn-dependent peptidase ImmA (M78 family) [Paenibacillus shirakamiensis]|uniref:Zn-dependent peptidase ImmA (M78 family) n=1 Tax=Paenibacillus shirakamiensis TaxID=1265935 RepID=A0ABS4JN52_9BACL|nr:ImmA/IrrE family metallo-endopeptidase [Paenibacillus shirakamiensis]MBP2002576.1 Zn-dependent peptidase ImmA (M78 family) [Paenibacillus shirakamiensis]
MPYSYYRSTLLEELISQHYIEQGFLTPEHLDIHSIAASFDIEVIYVSCHSFSEKEDRLIFLNKHSNELELREIFLHEVGHIVRHVGDQRTLPELFREGQEMEADQFGMYAAIPFFMLRTCPIPEPREEAIGYISATFKVSLSFAAKRLDQIERRVLQGQWDAFLSVPAPHNVPPREEQPIEGIQVYAYYDTNADVAEPSQILVEASADAMNVHVEFFFSIDGPYQRYEIEETPRYTYTLLTGEDLIYKKGQIGLNFAVLALKYGRSANRFILQMRDVELMMHF